MQTAKESLQLSDRKLSGELRLAQICIIQNRAASRELDARNAAESADAHCTYGKVDMLLVEEIEQALELCVSISPRCHFENIGASGDGGARFGAQSREARRLFEIVE